MSASVSTSDEAMYQETFLLVDRNCDGAIDLDEFRIFMRSLGNQDDDEKLLARMKSVGAASSLSKAQFVKLCSNWKSGTCNQKEICDALSVFDKSADGMGFISSRELGSALSNMGANPLYPQEVEQLLRRAQTNQDGQINYREWVKFVTK
eukprot:g2400.t1